MNNDNNLSLNLHYYKNKCIRKCSKNINNNLIISFPVCGTDGIIYKNPFILECAKSCGRGKL